ncbi:MAG: CBS domain-containing protein [Gammaproteobacteria bacterium]|nr:CBS domain-containing protein [Gammaproteobacteria bacterium]
MSIGEYCNRNVVTVSRDASLYEAAKLMRRYHVGDLVVADDSPQGRKIPSGLLTDRDIVVEALGQEVPDISRLQVKDIVSREVLTIASNHSLHEAIKMMRSHGVRRLPVVDSQGCLLGIITADDAYARLAGEFGELAQLGVRQRQIEAREHGLEV